MSRRGTKSNGSFGRLARKWWLMLAIGIVIGLAVGLPVGGKVVPGKLAGISVVDHELQVGVGQEFTLTPQNGYALHSFNGEFVQHMSTEGTTHTFKAKTSTEYGHFAAPIHTPTVVMFATYKTAGSKFPENIEYWNITIR